jgi:hypothetical protein
MLAPKMSPLAPMIWASNAPELQQITPSFSLSAATGLFRSDWHGWMGRDADIKLPHLPGHELAGEIVECGSEVRNLGSLTGSPFHSFADAEAVRSVARGTNRFVNFSFNLDSRTGVRSQNMSR